MTRKSPKLVALACRMYRKLGSGQLVAKRLQIAPTTLYRMLHEGGIDLPDKHGLEVNERKKKLHGETLTAALKDYSDGMGTKQLTKKYRCNIWTIREAAKRAGVPMKRHGGQVRSFTDAEKRQMVLLYLEDKLSQGQIAQHMQSSQSLVSRVLKAANVEIRGGSKKGEQHPGWKGGRSKTPSGYISVMLSPDDPYYCMADIVGRVMEHRIVMARTLRRPLTLKETVHHVDGDKTNNAPENLQLRHGKHGRNERMRCRACGSFDVECIEID